jgi:hypothetical protein
VVRSAQDAVVEQSLGRSSPFGRLRVDSNRAPDQVVAPATAAAANLVAKALRARLQGDADRASALVERAVQLEAAEEGDERWLDRALAAHGRAAGVGRQELAQLLAVVAHDYPLTHSELRRLRAVRREVDESLESLAYRWGSDAPLEDRRRVSTTVLEVVLDYVRTLSAATGD